MKAKQMEAQFEAQNQNKIKRHSTRRGMLTGLAAAAAVLICGTVTVGAANNWDYAAFFSKYFTEKSGEQVYYDFTGMGLDIGQQIIRDDYTLTVNSVLADTGAVYVAYDIRLSDEIQEKVAAYDPVWVDGGISGSVIQEGVQGTFSPEIRNGDAKCGEDGIYHGMMIMKMDAGTTLQDKQLEIESSELAVCYTTNPENGTGEILWLNETERDQSQERYVYDLSGITVQKGVDVPYGRTIPNDSNENIFDTMYLTPFMLRFESQGDITQFESSPHIGLTFLDPDPLIYGNDSRFKKVDVTYTAIYADGTEIPLKIIDGQGSSGSSCSRSLENGGCHWVLNVTHFFAAPLDFDGLTAIRINDVEVAVTPTE